MLMQWKSTINYQNTLNKADTVEKKGGSPSASGWKDSSTGPPFPGSDLSLLSFSCFLLNLLFSIRLCNLFIPASKKPNYRCPFNNSCHKEQRGHSRDHDEG